MNQTGAGARGLHATIAVNTEGPPLGVLRTAAPQPGAEKDKPRENRWIHVPRLLRHSMACR